MPLISEVEYKSKLSYRIVAPDEGYRFYELVRCNPKYVIAYDIETAESMGKSEQEYDNLTSTEITQIQFAVNKYQAIIFPRLEGEYTKIAQHILKLPNPKMGFNNWNFDDPIIEQSVGIIDPKTTHDLMWMFHHWQPKLPRGLQAVASLAGFPFPWKHLFGSDMEVYGGADVCSLHFILEWLPPVMKARGVWQGYMEYVYKLHHKVLYPAQKLGIPVNDNERLILKDKLVKMRDNLDHTIQENIPLELRNFEPKKKLRLLDDETRREFDFIQYGYTREPKNIITRAMQEYETAAKLLRERGKGVKSFESFLAVKYSLVKRQFDTINTGTGTIIKQERWCRFLPFKASFDQLSRYIRWKHDVLLASPSKEDVKLGKLYEVPEDQYGKKTTAKGEIEQLAEKTGDNLLGDVLEYRSLGVNITNYVPNWKPSPRDSCVHTTFGYSAASGQLDSRKPNVFNVSKYTDIGQLFRRIIECPKGYLFVEFDKHSFHVATMGYAANDASYIRFSQLDPHSIFASYIMPKEWGKAIDLELPDDEILDRCKWIKKKAKQEKEKLGDRGIDLRQDVAKKTVLGNQLGLGPRKLYWQNRRSFESISYAKYLQDYLADLFKKVTQFKKNIPHVAAKKTYLMNEFGYIQHFFDAVGWRWDKKLNGGMGGWKEQFGEEANDAIAFAVQSPAFGMIKDENYRIIPRLCELTEQFTFRLSIHDSLIYLFPEQYREEVVHIGLEEMNKPCRKLVNEATGPEGLKVGVEYTIGRNWQKWDKEKNPEGMREE